MQTEEKSARFIRGIGPKRFEALNRLGIHTIRDLCYFFPRSYEDRSHLELIAHIKPGTEVTIQGEVITMGLRQARQFAIFELILGDATGTVTAVWFNQSYLKNQFKVGDQIILSGKAERYNDRIQLNSPEYERVQNEETDPIHTARITPIYPLSEGLAQRSLRVAMKEVADQHVLNEIQEFLPQAIIETRRSRSLFAPTKNASQIDLAKIKKAIEEAGNKAPKVAQTAAATASATVKPETQVPAAVTVPTPTPVKPAAVPATPTPQEAKS